MCVHVGLQLHLLVLLIRVGYVNLGRLIELMCLSRLGHSGRLPVFELSRKG